MTPIPQPVPGDAPAALQCMEIWGGNAAADSAVSVPGIDAWVYSEPFGGRSGGDIHYLSMCGEGRITRFLLADVSGHGVEVSDIATQLRRLVRRNISVPDQARFVRAINRTFTRLSRDGVFATAAVATYFTPTNQFITCLAGHPRPLWYSAALGGWRLLSHDIADHDERPSGRNIPLGIIPSTDYHQFAVTLSPGDLIVMYSDALIEAGRERTLDLGEDGLLRLAAGLDPTPPAQFGRTLLGAVDAATGGRLQERSDDLTMLVLHHNAEDPTAPTLRERVRAIMRALGR